MTTKYYCSKCGSDRVWFEGWVAYNPESTGMDWQTDCEGKDYCDQCEDYTTITDEEVSRSKTPKGFGESS